MESISTSHSVNRSSSTGPSVAWRPGWRSSPALPSAALSARRFEPHWRLISRLCGGETDVFIDAAQRKAIIAAASPAAARFFRGFELTGARPKELAATRVADFNGQRLRLAHRKGRPVKLRPRQVVLSAEAVEFFKAQSKDKLPGAPLFTEDGETPWRRHACARAMQAAIARHNEVANGIKRILGHATAYSSVAAQTGTSVAMIEKAYLRFIPSAMQEKLAALKGQPSFEDR
jgi:integrase